MSSYEDFRGRLVCKSCGGLLEDAVQFLCGCRMCEKCAEDATRSANEGSFTCEACREVLTNGGDTLVSLNGESRPKELLVEQIF